MIVYICKIFLITLSIFSFTHKTIMPKHILFLSFFLLPFLGGVAQNSANEYFFYVQFHNKKGTPYSLDQPERFLSQRAIERRAFFSIPIDSLDLPVSSIYLSTIEQMGATVHATSKWLNGATIRLSDTTVMAQIRALQMVQSTQYTGVVYRPNTSSWQHRNRRELYQQTTDAASTTSQIEEMNAQILYERGFKGAGIHIAVIDAGFKNVDSNPGFQKMRDEGRLLGTKDFVNPSSNIYDEHHHGASVLSVMSGEIADRYIGTAPQASYWLLRTEEANNEYLYEPDLWMSAIEYADSVGVDVATTSLGYSNHFEDSSMNYLHSDLNGKTIRASIAAEIATQKGMLLLCSAGNDGSSSWGKISVPSDAKGVICVGAVDSDSLVANFSSYGPSADGRVKPELCARGVSTTIINTTGRITAANGTSFSAPLLAGAMACYLQAAKSMNLTFTLDQLKTFVFQSAHRHKRPTIKYGYGIPNFADAYQQLQNTLVPTLPISKVTICYNASSQLVTLKTDNAQPITHCQMYDMLGHLVYTSQPQKSTLTISTKSLSKGGYILKFVQNGLKKSQKIIL